MQLGRSPFSRRSVSPRPAGWRSEMKKSLCVGRGAKDFLLPASPNASFRPAGSRISGIENRQGQAGFRLCKAAGGNPRRGKFSAKYKYKERHPFLPQPLLSTRAGVAIHTRADSSGHEWLACMVSSSYPGTSGLHYPHGLPHSFGQSKSPALVFLKVP